MTETIELVNRRGSTSIHIDVHIKENGDLLFSGQDIGKAPEEIFGDSDYEYWLTIPAAENDFATPACFEQLLTWIAEDDCGNIVRPAMLALRLVFGHGLAKSTDLGP